MITTLILSTSKDLGTQNPAYRFAVNEFKRHPLGCLFCLFFWGFHPFQLVICFFDILVCFSELSAQGFYYQILRNLIEDIF